MLRELLSLAYEREIELEELLEFSNSDNAWFFQDTKNFNADIQVACLEKLERSRRIEEHKNSLH